MFPSQNAWPHPVDSTRSDSILLQLRTMLALRMDDVTHGCMDRAWQWLLPSSPPVHTPHRPPSPPPPPDLDDLFAAFARERGVDNASQACEQFDAPTKWRLVRQALAVSGLLWRKRYGSACRSRTATPNRM